MRTQYIIFAIVFLFKAECIFTAVTDNLKLELIQVLFRHGDRYPTEGEISRIGPDSFNRQYENFESLAQLTKDGMLREYKLGQMLRKRYDNFLGEFKYKEVVARSTDIDRAKMSLQLALAGLYPPTEKTAWSSEIAWSPIPITYVPADTDFLRISFKGLCTRNGAILDENEKSTTILGKLAKYKELEKKIANHTNIKVLTAEAGFAYNSYVSVMKSLGHPQPEFLTEKDISDLAEVSGLFFEVLTLTEEARRVMVGPTIKQMLKNIEENQEKKRKIILYSSHDTNVGTFVKALNFTGIPPAPEYGSAVLVEQLRDKNDKIYLKMFYWTGVSEELIPVKLENCNNACLLSTYTEIVKPMIPSEEQMYCFSLKRYCEQRAN